MNACRLNIFNLQNNFSSVLNFIIITGKTLHIIYDSRGWKIKMRLTCIYVPLILQNIKIVTLLVFCDIDYQAYPVWALWTSNITTEREREREMFYLTTHSTHFIYGYMASDIWIRTILIVRKETRCRHIGYSYRLTARVLLYAPSHRQDNTAFVTPVVDHWLEHKIAQWVHSMKDRSEHYNKTTLLS